MIGSDNIRRTDAGAFVPVGVGHAATTKCIRCEVIVGNSAARHDWRGIKKARWCLACDEWWQQRQQARGL